MTDNEGMDHYRRRNLAVIGFVIFFYAFSLGPRSVTVGVLGIVMVMIGLVMISIAKRQQFK